MGGTPTLPIKSIFTITCLCLKFLRVGLISLYFIICVCNFIERCLYCPVTMYLT